MRREEKTIREKMRSENMRRDEMRGRDKEMSVSLPGAIVPAWQNSPGGYCAGPAE